MDGMTYQEEKQIEGKKENELFRTGQIVSRNASDKTAMVKFDGEDEAAEKYYKYNKDMSFVGSDRVLCVRYSGTYIILCRI